MTNAMIFGKQSKEIAKQTVGAMVYNIENYLHGIESVGDGEVHPILWRFRQ